MILPGGAIDEYAVKAMDLNQSFIGQDFGIHRGGYVLYGKIGAIKVYETQVVISLANVDAEDIQLPMEQEIIFSHGQHENQVMSHLSEFSDHLRGRNS